MVANAQDGHSKINSFINVLFRHFSNCKWMDSRAGTRKIPRAEYRRRWAQRSENGIPQVWMLLANGILTGCPSLLLCILFDRIFFVHENWSFWRRGRPSKIEPRTAHGHFRRRLSPVRLSVILRHFDDGDLWVSNYCVSVFSVCVLPTTCEIISRK